MSNRSWWLPVVILDVAATAAVGVRLWLRAPHRLLPDFSLIGGQDRTFKRVRHDGA